ncbi:MAG: acyl-CoA dehydrogenase family protein [Pseudomonadota bacterium]|nr:acyl-CoA dehydrogenase family protein [Pseudomonadota bacterium]
MNLQLSPEDLAFRDEVRAFLREHLTPEIVYRSRTEVHPPNEADRRWWNAVLNTRGWAAPSWPVQHGGPGWTPIQRHLFEMECRLAGAPELRWQGLRLIGPVICEFGSDAQRKRYLPTILEGTEQWAQGFSEPGAGSDLASLKTTALLAGDEYVVNGQKLWTTEGGDAELGFFLVRTDTTSKHGGISMLIIDMKSPGVTVRPIEMINGDVSTYEVFLDNVRVPRENLIGEPGSAWTQTKFLLANERTSSADIDKAWGDLRRIRASAARERKNGRPLLEDPAFARRLAQLEMEVEALDWSVLRVLCGAPSRRPVAAAASVLKIKGSSLQHQLGQLAVDALGPRSLRLYTREQAFAAKPSALWPVDVPGARADQLYMRACTIYGGAMEVQKNIIAKIAFGLA